ncbi:S-adenosyl-L-methionine-dependent methyltransferase [Triangularia verruculosa]|uniref:S-adenosyl-L-methionine-dependent methyltransferase n=1 Tax=Triangularia verruculosa TaxID=2587418 RepID=A0AAN6XAW5_9PEZI|nr:S-adenosyl-L-methionine-dependent methyltransferase [Triangularia verruculosa]
MTAASTGTAFSKIDAALASCPLYSEFRRGLLDVATYQRWVENEGLASVPALNQDQINLSARFPHNKHDFVRRALAQCRGADILPDDSYDADASESALKRIDERFDHGRYLTYIFPEESALLYAVVSIVQPRRIAFLGSYYGYWAAAAAAAPSKQGIDLTLVDIDPDSMEMARHNLEKQGLSDNKATAFLVDDAEALAAAPAPELRDIDILVLDAEGPKSDDVPPDYRDKAIYYPHLRASLAELHPGALVVAHNVILSNFTTSAYFEEKQQYYRQQYTKFLALLRENFVYTVIDSTEGVLIARKL